MLSRISPSLEHDRADVAVTLEFVVDPHAVAVDIETCSDVGDVGLVDWPRVLDWGPVGEPALTDSSAAC